MNTDSTAVLNMLNTKYIIIPDNNHQPVALPNLKALGNAWFVKNYELVDNADAELSSLHKFNPSETAIINKKFAEDLKEFNPGRDISDVIRLENYAPNDLHTVTNQKIPDLLFFPRSITPKDGTHMLTANSRRIFRPTMFYVQ